ncbi:MAG: hypothetical protein JWP35_1860 [Caulobacter sp.]|nr:hypothetical protein [Caulobacter sp.]
MSQDQSGGATPRPSSIVDMRINNPRTGRNTGKDYLFANQGAVLAEIDALAGVTEGFIELKNAKGEVLEILSPGEKAFVVIRNRNDAGREMVNKDSVLRRVAALFEG